MKSINCPDVKSHADIQQVTQFKLKNRSDNSV